MQTYQKRNLGLIKIKLNYLTQYSFSQLPLLCRTAGDIVEVFLIKHSLVATHYARFSFASPNFKPEVDPLETEEYSAKSVPEDRNVIITVFIWN